MSKTRAWVIPAFTSLSMLVAFVVAPYYPFLETILKPYAKYNLSLLLLLNATHIHYRAVGKILRHRSLLLTYGILVCNVFLPLFAFGLCYLLWPQALVSAVLLSGISSGFSAVSFAILLRLAPETN
ncbi:MAG: hypothetical protein AAF975_07415, partial [Spirochaetota bacterium]